MKYLLIGFVLLLSACSSNTKTRDFYSDASYYKTAKSQEMPVDTAVGLYEKGIFTRANDLKLFQTLDNDVLWIHKKTTASTPTFLTLSLTYISSVKVYYRQDGQLTALEELSSTKHFPHQHIFYRHPSWKLPKSTQPIDLFIAVKNNSGRARLEFSIQQENEFLHTLETEYFAFGGFLVFLFLIAIILLWFALSRKRYSIIFYALYIICMMIEFLAGKGLGVQYIWSDVPFLVTSSRSFIQTIGVLCIGLFYAYFYEYQKNERLHKRIFLWCAYMTIPFILIYGYKAFVPSLERFYLWVWIAMKIVIIIFLINHIILARKGRLPIYLIVGFTIPLVVMLISQNINPTVTASWFTIKFVSNIYYLGLILEIIVFSYYISKVIQKTQNNLIAYQRANDELKLNFDQAILNTQDNVKSEVLARIHDTFSGYITALRYRLENTEDTKAKEAMDALHTNYRYLLNNLYTPNIKAENFIQAIREYLDKMNALSSNSILHSFEIKDLLLSTNACEHSYSILSELVTNALKHAKASRIHVLLNQETATTLTLKVIDNGIGFNPNSIPINSYGLKNIRNRILEIKGSLDIDSTKDGTIITILIPYDKQD